MLIDPIEDAEDRSAADVHESYLAALADVVDDVGVEAAAAETGIEAATLESLVAGETPELTVEEAAEIVALTDEWPDARSVKLEIRDHLMLGMSSAILDVDALETALDGAMTAKEVQAKIEGRQPMTLAEYALVALTIERENDFS